MTEIKGYKAFNKDKTNRYGIPFVEGKTYRVCGDISFGNEGNGYHMCSSLSDVFRFVNALEDEVMVAEVTGRGAYVKYDDEYNGYFDMYSFEEITIDRFLSRTEIINKILNSTDIEVKKFLITCKLSDSEKALVYNSFCNNKEVIKCLLYYHFNCKKIYEDRKYEEDSILRLVLKYGQNNNKGS